MIVITLICSACVYKIDVKDILSLKILEKVLILFFTLKKKEKKIFDIAHLEYCNHLVSVVSHRRLEIGKMIGCWSYMLYDRFQTVTPFCTITSAITGKL